MSASIPLEQQPLYARIYRVVRQIPPGRVATYGQIAGIVGDCTARMVGYAMAAAPEDVPWQRVIDAQGKVSPRHDQWGAEAQRRLLQEEGLHLDASGAVDLAAARWSGPDLAWLAAHGFALPEERAWQSGEDVQPRLF